MLIIAKLWNPSESCQQNNEGKQTECVSACVRGVYEGISKNPQSRAGRSLCGACSVRLLSHWVVHGRVQPVLPVQLPVTCTLAGGTRWPKYSVPATHMGEPDCLTSGLLPGLALAAVSIRGMNLLVENPFAQLSEVMDGEEMDRRDYFIYLYQNIKFYILNIFLLSYN